MCFINRKVETNVIIRLPSGEITVDGKAVLKDVKLNIASNNQLRLKFIYFTKRNVEIPLDIVVYKYTKPVVEKLTNVVIYIDGEELNNGINFNLKLTYSILNRRLNVSGNIGDDNININMYNALDALVLLDKITKCMLSY